MIQLLSGRNKMKSAAPPGHNVPPSMLRIETLLRFNHASHTDLSLMDKRQGKGKQCQQPMRQAVPDQRAAFWHRDQPAYDLKK